MHLLKFDDYLLQMVCKSMKESDFCNSEDWMIYQEKNSILLSKVKRIMNEIKSSANIDQFTPFPFSTNKELIKLAEMHSNFYQDLESLELIEINRLLNMKACTCDKSKAQALHAKLSIVNI